MSGSYEEFKEANPHLSRFIPYLELLIKESARGKVLISTGFLEELLREVLLAFTLEVRAATELISVGKAYLRGARLLSEKDRARSAVGVTLREAVDRYGPYYVGSRKLLDPCGAGDDATWLRGFLQQEITEAIAKGGLDGLEFLKMPLSGV